MQEQILEALRSGANDEALALARAAVEAEPGSAQAHRMLASALNAGGDRDAALAAIDRALGIVRDDPDAHFQRAVILAGGREVEAAQAALAKSIQLNPNQFNAYILQAQLALGRGDLDEAERLARLAGKIAPSHPWQLAIEGMVALGRRRADEALALLSQAAAAAPEDTQVLLGLALAYIAKGHDAFAEQALRNLLARQDGPPAWLGLLAETIQRQQRPDDALAVLQPSLDGGSTPPALRRLAGELELQAGRPQEALAHLRGVLAAEPRDARALAAAMSAWQRLDARDDARATLDAALATSPTVSGLWQARLVVEGQDADAMRAVLGRWQQALPEDPLAMDARMRMALRGGDAEAALELAHALVARVPGHRDAHGVIIDALHRRDPGAAIDYVAGLLAEATSGESREMLGAWLALLQDSAGRHAEAVACWASLAEQRLPARLPLPPVSRPPEEVPAGAWPEWSVRDEEGEPLQTLFLWGPPGSCVENVAATLAGFRGFRADRLSPRAPGDVFQRFASVPGLSEGTLDPGTAAREWREGLAARGIEGQHVIEWLVWWDNALLRVLRSHVDKAGLLFVVRDPRDMLVQWAAFESPMRIGMPSMEQAAAWLACVLAQIADLVDAGLYRASVLRIDGAEGDAGALGEMLSQAIGLPPPAARPVATAHFAAGHWRKYADVLAGPFGILAPIAKRLGYPET